MGNTRVRFADIDGNSQILVDPESPEDDELLGSYQYYPFGMQWDGSWSNLQGGNKNRYTYNGKEEIDAMDIGWQYYGFRMYDPSIGRFTSVDPISDEFAHVSTFNYAENSPIANVDLWGLQAVSIHADARVSALATGSVSGGIVFDFKGNVGLFGTVGLGGGYIGGASVGGGASFHGDAKDVNSIAGWGLSAVASGFLEVGVSGSVDISIGENSEGEYDVSAFGATGAFGVGLEAGAAGEVTYTWVAVTTWEEIGQFILGSGDEEKKQYRKGLSEATNLIQNAMNDLGDENSDERNRYQNLLNSLNQIQKDLNE